MTRTPFQPFALLGLPILLLAAGCGGAQNPQRLIEQARAAEKQGHLVEAKKLYEEALEKDPHHVGARESYGELLLRLEERELAVEQLKRGVALCPERLACVVPLARLYLESRQLDEAEKLLAPWKGDHNPPADITLVRAELDFRKGRRAEARSLLAGLAGSSSQSGIRAKLKLAAFCLLDSDAPAAEKLLRGVLAAQPKNLEASIGLGDALLAQGKLKEAEEQFVRAWTAPEKPPLAAIGLIVSGVKKGDLAGATAAARELSAAYPRELNFAVLTAELAAAANQPEVLSALQLPDQAGAIKQYIEGLQHLSSQQYYDSYPLLVAVAEKWSDYGPAQLFAGRAALQLKDRSQALSFFKNAQEHLPPNPETSSFVVRAALAQSQNDLAVKELSKLSQADPEASSIKIESAFRRGDYAQALAEIDRWKAGHPDSLLAIAAAGDVQDAMGRPDEALKLWTQAASGEGFAPAWAGYRIAMAGQNWTEALAALDRIAGQVDKSTLEILQGQAEMGRGSASLSRSHFEAAIQDDPRNAAAYAWMGLWQVFQREVSSGHENFKKALELNPDEPLALFGEGFIAMLDKSHAAAAESFQKALRASAGFDAARLLLADALIADGRPAEALVALEKLGPLLKDSAPALETKGRALILTRNWADATQCWKSYQEKYPKSGLSYFYLSQIQFIAGDKAAARGTAEAGLKVAPTDVRLQLSRADLLWDSGQKEEALLLSTKLAKSEKSYEAAVLQAAMHLKRGHYSKASTVLKDLMTAYPDDARIYSLLCDAQLSLNKPEEATLTLRTGWLRLPRSIGLGFRLAQIQEQQQNWQDAISTYREILKIRPDSVRALNLLAWRLAEQGGDLTEALQLSEEACKRSPADVAALDTRAWIHFLRDDFPEARKQLDDLLKAAPEDPFVRYHWSMARWKTGDNAAAKEALQKLLQQEPNFVEAEKIKDVLQRI